MSRITAYYMVVILLVSALSCGSSMNSTNDDVIIRAEVLHIDKEGIFADISRGPTFVLSQVEVRIESNEYKDEIIYLASEPKDDFIMQIAKGDHILCKLSKLLLEKHINGRKSDDVTELVTSMFLGPGSYTVLKIESEPRKPTNK